MNLRRLRVCEEADLRLRILKARTGLAPNLLCRLGFCLSLNDPTPPDPAQYPEDGPLEIDFLILTEQWNQFFLALLHERLVMDGLDLGTDLAAHFRAHLNRGILLLYQRLRGLEHLALLVTEGQ